MLTRSRLSVDTAWLLVVALTKFVLHLAVNLFGAYGYIRDELYYLACSDHLAWGYVDHPPLSIAVLWGARHLIGDSLFALRLIPAVCGAAVVVLAGLMARELGGGRAAQVLAAIFSAASPLLLGMDSLYSMNALDILLQTAAIYVFARALKRNALQEWVVLGVLLGLGLENKISVLWLGAGFGVALLATRHRSLLRSRGPWIAGAIALACFVPHLVWQVSAGWPTLEFMKNAATGKYLALSPFALFLQQVVFMNPATAPYWIGGLFMLIASRRVAPDAGRALAIVYATVFSILAVQRNIKVTYLVTLFPMLMAVAGLAAEKLSERLNRRWPSVAAGTGVVLCGLLAMPFVLAVLPVERYVAYARLLGVAPATSERNPLGALPQHFADMFGWPEMTATVAAAYASLTPDERAACVILCGNYGEAGAIDFFGRRYGLRRAVSGHNNYWLWGPGTERERVVIRLGGSPRAVAAACGDAVLAGVVRHPYSMPYENELPVWVCRAPKVPLVLQWSGLKVFN